MRARSSDLATRLDAYMAAYRSPIEIGHAAEHLGVGAGLHPPYWTQDEVRAQLAYLMAYAPAAAVQALEELEECPW